VEDKRSPEMCGACDGVGDTSAGCGSISLPSADPNEHEMMTNVAIRIPVVGDYSATFFTGADSEIGSNFATNFVDWSQQLRTGGSRGWGDYGD